jgi:ketosteroid isomerase-like protein
MSLPAAITAAQQPAKSTAVSPEFKEMQQVEDRWNEAITKRDQYGLELVLAPQFIGISATGDVATRNQQIAQLLVKGAGPDSLQQKVVSVRFVGDVAIVNGTYVMSWKTDKGPVLEKGIFSHVFEHVRTTWLCLNSQRTVVAEDTKRTATAQEKPKSKSTDAQLPMHIPMVYKGPNSTQPQPKPDIDQPNP